VPDELTLGELGRRLDAGFAEVKEDFRTINSRLDGKVDVQLLALQQQAQDERHKTLVEQVAALRKDLDQRDREQRAREVTEEKRNRDYRRWLIGAIVIPVLVVLLPLLATRGKL
jgi:hypothetical protein